MRSIFQRPIFFPDATRAVVRTLDSTDIANTKTKGVLVNTYHLLQNPGEKTIKKAGGVKNFMNFKGPMISDSGGFQVMSLLKKTPGNGKVTDEGVTFKVEGQKKMTLTPESSLEMQFALKTDLMVVLDDFTHPTATYDEAKESVERTLLWAKRSKIHFEKLVKKTNHKPLLIGVVQGGKYQDLRKYCIEELVKIGFDGLGYGGWPMDENNKFDIKSAKTITDNAPTNYLLYGLGIGKPEDIVSLSKLRFTIFDCVLPTRDARHKRLYVYDAKSVDGIDLSKKNFYSFYTPDKMINKEKLEKVSTACDCLLCTKYTKSYLYHLWKINDISAMRLSTIHNLRFYSLLMEKLSE